MRERGHLFTLKEAARSCDVSAQTIRRRLRDDAFPNATKESLDGVETWQIPLGDLLAAGFSPTSDGRPAPSEPTPTPTTDVVDERPAPVQAIDVDKVAELRAELVEAKHRAELAEARAEERQRSIDILERQVLMLMPGPAAPTVDDGPVVLTEPVPEAPLRKKSWWRR